jgi:hypothetical protein
MLCFLIMFQINTKKTEQKNKFVRFHQKKTNYLIFKQINYFFKAK